MKANRYLIWAVLFLILRQDTQNEVIDWILTAMYFLFLVMYTYTTFIEKLITHENSIL